MIPIARHSALRAARSQLNPTRALRQPASSALARLLSTLAVLEQREGKLQNSSLSAIAAAQKLGGPVTAFLAGSGVKGTSAAEAAKIQGLDKVIAVESDAYEKVCIYTPVDYNSHNRLLRAEADIYPFFSITGPPRKLCPSSGREHQEGRIHPHRRRPLCLRQESSSPSRRSPRRPANF
jgi:hypothetical protein